MKKIPVAANLSDSEYQLLLQVYSNHNWSMGLEKIKNYTLSDFVKVVRDKKEKCLSVHYKKGDWWHCTIKGTWY